MIQAPLWYFFDRSQHYLALFLICINVVFLFINNCLSLFQLLHLDFLHLAEQVGGEHEVVEFLVGRRHDVVLCALPFLVALVYEDDVLADAHDGVHVVGVDDGRDVILLGD